MTATPHATGIILYGGTFDPVHHGHLITAQAAREALGAARVLFMPARQNPHKACVRSAAAADRLAMLRAATAGMTEFAVSDLELSRAGPSYTIDTVRTLRQAEPAARLVLLLGADQLPTLPMWYEAAALLELVEPAVLRRPEVDAEAGLAQVAARMGAATAARLRGGLLDTPLVAISATDVRARVAGGRSIRYLVPADVEAYIQRHKLYL